MFVTSLTGYSWRIYYIKWFPVIDVLGDPYAMRRAICLETSRNISGCLRICGVLRASNQTTNWSSSNPRTWIQLPSAFWVYSLSFNLSIHTGTSHSKISHVSLFVDYLSFFEQRHHEILVWIKTFPTANIFRLNNIRGPLWDCICAVGMWAGWLVCGRRHVGSV
jgi:hypothetical protein